MDFMKSNAASLKLSRQSRKLQKEFIPYFESPEEQGPPPQRSSRYSQRSVFEPKGSSSLTCRSACIPLYTSVFEEGLKEDVDIKDPTSSTCLDSSRSLAGENSTKSTFLDNSTNALRGASNVIANYKDYLKNAPYMPVVPPNEKLKVNRAGHLRVRPKKVSGAKHMRRNPLEDTLLGKIWGDWHEGLSPDGGYDWRFLSSEEYLEVQLRAQSHRRWDVLKRLRECVHAGTTQALTAGKYPSPIGGKGTRGWNQSIQETAWIDLSSYRHHVLRMMWYSAKSLSWDTHAARGSHAHDMAIKDDMVTGEPPLICMSMSPLDSGLAVAAELKKCSAEGEKVPICLVVDLDFPVQSGEGGNPGVETFQESFFHRTDMREQIAEAERRLQHSQSLDSSSLKEHLVASRDPFVLHCDGVVVFREGTEKGYAFMEEPYVLDGVLLMALDTQFPVVSRFAKGRDEYANEEQVKSLAQRLRLVCQAAIASHDSPVLVLSLPGLLDRRRHPFHSVAYAIRQLRLQFARQFRAVVVACGSQEAALKVDVICNHELYGPSTGHLKDGWRAPSVDPLCVQLAKLSANPVWQGGNPIVCSVRPLVQKELQLNGAGRGFAGNISLGDVTQNASACQKNFEKAKSEGKNEVARALMEKHEAEKLAEILKEEEKVKESKTGCKTVETEAKTLARRFLDAGIILRRKKNWLSTEHRTNSQLLWVSTASTGTRVQIQ